MKKSLKLILCSAIPILALSSCNQTASSAITFSRETLQVLYDRMFDRRVDNSKILKVTATSPSEFTSLREGLSCELRRFINSPHYRGVNIWQNALIDRLCGTIMPLDELSLKQKLLYLKDRYALLGKVLGVMMPLYHKIRN